MCKVDLSFVNYLARGKQISALGRTQIDTCKKQFHTTYGRKIGTLQSLAHSDIFTCSKRKLTPLILSHDHNSNPIDHMRRTTSDAIFDEILQQITSLTLKPGEKVSEGEIARIFDVSRQPVREAFIRLAHIGLLVIRPQRVTTVRKISRRNVANARFVRMAIELEALREACKHFDDDDAVAFTENLQLQRQAVQDGDADAFRTLDSEFHKMICVAARRPDAYQDILDCKTKVDRLCALSLQDPSEIRAAFKDHVELVAALENNDVSVAEELMRNHLYRLDAFISSVAQNNSEYFED